MRRVALCAGLLLSATIAQGQAPAVSIEEIAEGIHVNIDSGDAEGFGEYLRPLDDSNPEMKQLMEAFFELTPCGNAPHGICDDALQMLVGGGDRLARYLIQQVEQNEAEGFPNRGTYLRLLGHTETEVAFVYLADLLQSRRAGYARGNIEHQSYLVAIESLGRTRRVEVIEKVMPVLEADDDPVFQNAAVNALDRVPVKHGPIPAVAVALRALEQRNAGRREARARSGELLFTADPDRDPWQEVDRRIGTVLANPGHTKP